MNTSTQEQTTHAINISDLSIGDRLTDRWATLYIFEHDDIRYAVACEVVNNIVMNDDEKLQDFKERKKDAYAWNQTKIKSLVERAKKRNDKLGLLLQFSLYFTHLLSFYDESIVNGSFITIDASVFDIRKTSVQMRLSQVSDHGRSCLQWFDEKDMRERFVKK